MVYQIPYKSTLPGFPYGLLVKKSSAKYLVFYPEVLDNGTIRAIARDLVAKEFDWSAGAFTDVGRYSIESATKYANPIVFGYGIGYDFDNDRILLVVGEWDGVSKYQITTRAKLVAINRDLSGHDVLIDDILALVKQAASDVDEIRYYGHAYIHSKLGAVVVGAYAAGAERSVVIVSTDGGETWSAVRANARYDFIQERLEPFWDGDAFMGFLTEGHGTNSLWIKTDGSIRAGAPGGLYTTEPIYDMINNQIIWIEWGSGLGDVQRIWVASPRAPFDAVDVTPGGTLTDNEGNSIDLSRVCKIDGVIFTDGKNNKFVFQAYRGGIPEGESRIIATDLPVQSGNAYDIVEDSDGSDVAVRITAMRNIVRAVDPATRKLIPVPIITKVLP